MNKDRPPGLELLRLEQVDEGRFVGGHEGDGVARDVVFGGQILAQVIAAASTDVPDKRVKSVQAIFARAARHDAPLEIDLDPVHDGRTFASRSVRVHQGDRNCVQAIVLLDVEEPDLISHAAECPAVPGPDECETSGRPLVFPGAEERIVGAVDTWSIDATVGPAELFVWTRLPGEPLDLATSQAVLAWATDGYLIGTAMRPHAGVGQDEAHRSISTGVISESLTFHGPFDASEWLLLTLESPYAGGGRTYGRAHVFTESGRHVASFVQENIVRHLGGTGTSGYRTAM